MRVNFMYRNLCQINHNYTEQWQCPTMHFQNTCPSPSEPKHISTIDEECVGLVLSLALACRSNFQLKTFNSNASHTRSLAQNCVQVPLLGLAIPSPAPCGAWRCLNDAQQF